MTERKNLGVFGGYFAKQCPEYVRKEYSPFYPNELKDEIPAVATARMADGVQFEAEVIEELKRLHAGDPGVVFLTSPEDRSDREQMQRWQRESMEAFRNPDVWFIVNPRLAPVRELNLTGEPDFAVRQPGLGWAGVDAKHHRETAGSSKATDQRVSSLNAPKLEDAVNIPLIGSHRLDDSLQLAHYHRMFVAHGLASDDAEVWGGIIGTSKQVLWRRLDIPMFRNVRTGSTLSALDYYQVEREFRLDIVEREFAREQDSSLAPLVGAEQCSSCSDCPWVTICMDELREMDHVSLLPGLTGPRVAALRSIGVTKSTELARLDYRTATVLAAKIDAGQILRKVRSLPKTQDADSVETVLTGTTAGKASKVAQLASLGFNTVGDLRSLHAKTAGLSGAAASWLPRAIDQARVSGIGKVHLARDVNFVGFPRAAIEVDVDFEDSNGYTYMFGMLITGRKISSNGDRKSRSEYRAFCSWDQTDEGEAKAFAEFWGELQRLQEYAKANKWGFRSYFYTPHETHAIRTLAERHAGRPGVPTVAEVEAYMNSDRWIDLYPIVSKQMIWPVASYTVKSLAKYVRHSWSGEGANGALSLVWYEEALNHPDPAVRQQRQEELLTYNRQDNEATFKIREWITELSDNQRRPGEKLPSVDTLDRRFVRRR